MINHDEKILELKERLLEDYGIKTDRDLMLKLNIEDENKKKLISSYSYSPDKKETIESEIFYFKKLKKYFYDNRRSTTRNHRRFFSLRRLDGQIYLPDRTGKRARAH